ncbi:hypothetical protein AAF712_009309 [Marasmius tenuissimus]|uniref:Pectate lyase n=1 Tax=Marasmius tenuissimus TaxID=585030 RepID=A0ABR2ZPZ8_9AGAR
MIFDHVSVSWGRDETFSINGDVSNVSIQDSIIAQGLDTHSCGGLIQTDGGVSIIRTLYIDNKTRNPKVKGVNEFVNNVVSTTFARKAGTLKGWAHLIGLQLGRRRRFDYPTVATLRSPTDALDYVLAHAGASKSRDHVDTYLIDTEVRSWGKKGAIISDENASPINGPGPISGGTAPVDTDKDGIPDAYESAHGTNPNVADSATIASNGYSNLENYINSLV